MNNRGWSLAALSMTALALLGLVQSPLPQPQLAAPLVERVAALETAVVSQTEFSQELARRIEVLEALVGVTATPAATPTPPPSPTSAPSYTPTSALTPFATPLPTPTLTAAVLSGPDTRAANCEEILRVWREGSTDEFLELRRTRVIDRWLIDWEGTVSLVHTDLTFMNNEYYILVEPDSVDNTWPCGVSS